MAQICNNNHAYLKKGRTVFIGDTSIHERPTGEELANIAEVIAAKATSLGNVPRVAFCHSQIWQPEIRYHICPKRCRQSA